MLQAKKRLLNASFISLRYKRWSCTKQPSWNFSNNFFQPIYSLEQKLIGMHHATWSLRINKIIPFRYQNKTDILIFFKQHLPTHCCSKQKLNGMRRATWRLRIAKSSHSLIKNVHALNSHLEILQTTSFKPFVLLGKALMVGISRFSQKLKSLHSDTNDGHALNSLHGILQTTSSKLNALLRLRTATIFPFRYQRWPWTKQPSWNYSNNIFKPIFSLEQKIDGSLQGKMETQNFLNHSIQISKMAIHLIAIFIFFKQHIPPNRMSYNELRISKIRIA